MSVRPQLWVFAGPNGAGKSTLARKHIVGRVRIVNPDDIAREIAPDHHGDPAVMMKAGRMAVQERRALLAAGESFAMETTLTGQSELAFMAEARKRGFKVNLVFVGVRSVDYSRGRVAERVKRGGHPVARPDIERRFPRSMEHLSKAMRLAHRTFVVDNTGIRERLLLSRENKRTRFVSRSMPQWARDAIPAALRRVKERGIEL